MAILSESYQDARPIRGDDSPWAEFFPGIEVKVLRACFAHNSYTILSRFAPGITLPRHKHFGEVQAYTLSGRWRYLEYDWVASAGSLVYEPPGATHTLHVDEDATEPAVILFAVTGGMALLDDEDQVWMLEDAPTMVERYQQTLEASGIPVPVIL
jgi:quercetin dioxygenase-like cupin family protein